jgi:hypothetical protein
MDNNNPSLTTEGPPMIEGAGYPPAPLPTNPPSDDELSPILGAPPPALPATRPAESLPVAPADPEFDAYMAVVKLLIGGTIEGTAELARRLERIEAQLRASEDRPLRPGEVKGSADVVRYMLGGMVLSAAEGARRQAFKLAQASDLFWRFTGSAIEPLTGNRVSGRVVGPFDRAFSRLVDRGQKRVNAWVELGRAHEPSARLIARQTYLEIVDDFITHLSKNQQLADLVQEQSVGLANEVVDEVRERTVSADTLAESIVRRILKRPPRDALPPPPDEIRQAVAEIKRVPRHDSY